MSSTLKKLISIIAVIGIVAFLVYSSVNKIGGMGALEKNLEEKKQELKVVETKLARLKSLQDNRNVYDQRIAEYNRAIPKTPQQRELYEQLKWATYKNNVFINDMQFQDIAKRDGYTEMPVALTIHGAYNNVIYTLEQIRGIERLVGVNKIELERSSSGVMAQIQLESFYQSARQNGSGDDADSVNGVDKAQ